MGKLSKDEKAILGLTALGFGLKGLSSAMGFVSDVRESIKTSKEKMDLMAFYYDDYNEDEDLDD